MCPIPSKVDTMNSTTIATRSIVEFYKHITYPVHAVVWDIMLH